MDLGFNLFIELTNKFDIQITSLCQNAIILNIPCFYILDGITNIINIWIF